MQPLLIVRGSKNGLEPIHRLPTAVVDSYLHAMNVFKDNIAIFFPAFAVWNLGLLMTHGWKYWLSDALKTGIEWGLFGATYSGGERFFTRIRGVDDKLNQYIACGICSGLHRASEGVPSIAQGFVTGFSFVCVLEYLMNRLAEDDVVQESSSSGSGRSALEGTLAARGRSRLRNAVPIKNTILSKVAAPIVLRSLPRVGLPAAAASTSRHARGYFEFTKRKILPNF